MPIRTYADQLRERREAAGGAGVSSNLKWAAAGALFATLLLFGSLPRAIGGLLLTTLVIGGVAAVILFGWHPWQ